MSAEIMNSVDQISLMRELSIETPSKIVMIVLDGLGGLPSPETGRTELESAVVPNLNALAAKCVCGLSDPVMPGITPGSGPGHLGLFGYDPLKFTIGRGILEALGIDFDLEEGDVAARGNLCTLDDNGVIVDRRAGRISTEKSQQIAALLNNTVIDGVQVLVEPVKDHRLVAVFRGEGLSDALSDSDPQRTGSRPLPVFPTQSSANRTASIVNRFLETAAEIISDYHPANGLLLRGFSKKPSFSSFKEVYKLNACAIAGYPMYRGLAKVVGMTVLKCGTSLSGQLEILKANYRKFDFFFFHVKATDAAGEDGNFQRKVSAIEEFDRWLPFFTELNPDVILVTGDHSTPAMMGSHSWHPVPVMVSGRYCRPDKVREFNETACCQGGLGRLPAYHLMPLVMANALKLGKYGA
ncbi:2,3-bisphosphoglycerate-independent phosphoglycerate mutase [Dehalogenimonas sp. 4OHTPN]|uniref:2,3-bisphosphoglycerate-independent phosphoglycerate mutase n=1 Tax=Dehalogenimonas sp. 4OHTPN TaxID=3166643 RepID=A0AAU8G837_9CHLR